jgi:hypothetical protein
LQIQYQGYRLTFSRQTRKSITGAVFVFTFSFVLLKKAERGIVLRQAVFAFS